ncbi:hypothetical protein K470DRAFT_20245 [Piedraia hortae CBS 480.64]|uniref:Uncharacterized protein n=1 Tax=Piedraia hortae CBS 480.64 TaxID=1314780 RepID=A0A6A7BNN0_9PEZI|nr:hypothetical protein K470DRAFT_20245 [Piedraia hortae CBS 480.64]
MLQRIFLSNDESSWPRCSYIERTSPLFGALWIPQRDSHRHALSPLRPTLLPQKNSARLVITQRVEVSGHVVRNTTCTAPVMIRFVTFSASNAMILPSTRELIMYLAGVHAKPPIQFNDPSLQGTVLGTLDLFYTIVPKVDCNLHDVEGFFCNQIPSIEQEGSGNLDGEALHSLKQP